MNNIQKMVHNAIESTGGLWERDKILLKLAEEVGELLQAFRKKTVDHQFEEFGDVVFTLCCLAQREGFDLELAVAGAVDKHYKLFPK